MHGSTRFKGIVDTLADLVETAKECSLVDAVGKAVPWMGAVGGALAESVGVAKFAIKLIEKLTVPDDPKELGHLALQMAYQAAMARAMKAKPPSAPFNADASTEAARNDVEARLLAYDPGTAGASFERFTLTDVTSIPYVRTADAMVRTAAPDLGYAIAEIDLLIAAIHDRLGDDLRGIITHRDLLDRFAPLTAYLQLGADKESSAYEALYRHADFQRRLFEETPVLNVQPFALKDIYVDTGCGVLEWRVFQEQRDARPGTAPALRIDAFREEFGGRKPTLDTVLDAFADPKFDDVVVLQGVAGSGKSSFTLALAARLRAEGLRPLRIRLRDMKLDGRGLYDTMKDALRYDDKEPGRAGGETLVPEDVLLGGRIFTRETQFRSVTICPYVVILDGWDEISVSVSEGFKKRLERFLDQVRSHLIGRAIKVRVILTGRPSDVVFDSGFLQAPSLVLTLRPFQPSQLREFFDGLRKALAERSLPCPNSDEWALGEAVVYADLFERYEASFQADTARVPSPATLDILGLPLLALLAFRAMANQPPGQEAELISNRTTLFRTLIDLTAATGGKAKGEELERDGRVHVRGWKLRSLLQATAVAMNTVGQENVSYVELDRRLKETRGKLMEEVARLTHDQPLSALTISFFFKGGYREFGCEFSHKSFREYLLAEAIIECLKEFAASADRLFDRKDRQLEAPGTEYWQDFDRTDPRHVFSRKLAELLAPQWLSPEVVEHLERLVEWEIGRSTDHLTCIPAQGAELAPLSADGWTIVRDGLADLWRWWAEGVHMRPQPHMDIGRWSFSEAPAMELFRWIVRRDRPDDVIAEPNRLITVDSHLGDGLFRLCALAHFHLAKRTGWLESAYTNGVFSPAELWSGNFGSGHLCRPYQVKVTKPSGAWILFAPSGSDGGFFKNFINRINASGWRPQYYFPSGVNMNAVYLFEISFDRVVLINSSLDYVNLVRSVFFASTATQTSVRFALCRETVMSYLLLRECAFDGAVLSHAFMERVRAMPIVQDDGGGGGRGVTFSNCHLDGVNLNEAHLNDAKFDGAVLTDATLARAVLDGADFSRADGITQEMISGTFADEPPKLPQGMKWSGRSWTRRPDQNEG